MRSLTMRFAMVFSLAGLCTSAARAQDAAGFAAVVPGARVSFTLSDVQSPEAWPARRLLMKGTVSDVRADSLVIQFNGAAPITVSRLAIGDLSVSRGMERGWKTHPRSTAIGAALLVGNAFLFHRIATGPSSTVTRRSSSLPLAGLLGFNAAVFFRQAFTKKERWERVAP